MNEQRRLRRIVIDEDADYSMPTTARILYTEEQGIGDSRKLIIWYSINKRVEDQ